MANAAAPARCRAKKPSPASSDVSAARAEPAAGFPEELAAGAAAEVALMCMFVTLSSSCIRVSQLAAKSHDSIQVNELVQVQAPSGTSIAVLRPGSWPCSLRESVEQLEAVGDFFVGRGPAERESKRMGDLVARIVAGFGRDALGELAGLLVEELAVEHRQRLARLRRDEAGFAAGVDVGKVERREQRRQQRPLDVDVDAAAAPAPRGVDSPQPSPGRDCVASTSCDSFG